MTGRKHVARSVTASLQGPPRKKGVNVVVLDIEGTTTPITFVHDVLFGYVRQQLDPFLSAAGSLQPAVSAAMTHYGAHDTSSLVPLILGAMDRDDKVCWDFFFFFIYSYSFFFLYRHPP